MSKFFARIQNNRGHVKRSRALADPPPLRLAVMIGVAPRKLGGSERWMLAFVKEGLGRGHQVHLATRCPALEEWVEQVEALGATWSPLDALGTTIKDIRRSVEDRFDAVNLNLLAPRGTHAMASYLARGVSTVFVDRISDEPAEPMQPLLSRVASLLADRVTIHFIDQLVGISDYVTERDKRRFGGPAHKYSTIYNGVDLTEYRPTHRSSQRPVITVVANLIPQKGVDSLIEACGHLGSRDYLLRIVGDGPEEAHLAAMSRQLDLEGRVEFLGLRNDVNVILGESDIFAHPAVWNEAFGYTVAEAMASGCAVVASEVGAMPELLSDGAGVLIPPGSAQAMGDALASLLDDPRKRARLGQAARTRAVEMFDVRKSASAHVAACERAAGV